MQCDAQLGCREATAHPSCDCAGASGQLSPGLPWTSDRRRAQQASTGAGTARPGRSDGYVRARSAPVGFRLDLTLC